MRASIAFAVGKLGDRWVAAELVRLLPDTRINRNFRVFMAFDIINFGERAAVPELVRLLSDEKLDANVRVNNARSVGALREDEVMAYKQCPMACESSCRCQDFHRQWI